MFDALIQALLSFTFEQIAYTALGVLMGLMVGIIPGLGGVVGMSLLLPFVFGMEPTAGIAMLIGMVAVTQTSDIFPAVLFGIPGSTGGATLILDGYPLGRRGEAMRVLRLSFTVSMLGGLFGAIVLLLFLPLARPLMLALRTPELFVLTLLGLSMVGVLSASSALAGLAAGLFGMLLSTVGIAVGVPFFRYTFNIEYLGDGVSIVLVGLGIFGISELIDLLVGPGSTGSGVKALRNYGFAQTIRDVIAHKWLLLRSSAAGSMLGIIPGIGGSAVDWIIYGLTVQTSKDKSQFGKGDIRGVLGPGSADNAKEGGVLIPTLFFGIPGSGTTAVLLGGLLIMGIQAGPNLAKPENVSIVYVVVITLAIANVAGAILCWIASRWVAQVTTVSIKVLAPIVWILIAGAAYQTSHRLGDLIALICLGAFAVAMTRAGWPKAPMLVGFVLGPSAERYLSISVARYGTEWLTRPGVLILAALVLLSAIVGLWSTLGRREMPKLGRDALPDVVFSAFATAAFLLLAYIANGFIESARWFPLGIATAGTLFSALHLALQVRALLTSATASNGESSRDVDPRLPAAAGPMTVTASAADHTELSAEPTGGVREVVYWLAWLAGYIALAVVVGQLAATGLWILAFILIETKSTRRFAFGLAGSLILLQIVLEHLTEMRFLPGLLWS